MEKKDEADLQNVVLTIIIATYNAGKHLKGCIESIIENVTGSYELLIVDGNSQDNTLAIVHEFNLLNCTVISEPDNGIYDAMNKGVAQAHGKWIMFLGADDKILSSFSKIFPLLQDTNAVYYGNCKNEAHQLGGKFSAYKLAKMNLCHQAILYPKAVFNRYRFSLNYPVFGDYLLNLQCWGDANFKKTYLNIDLAYYNMEGFSSIAQDDDFKRDKPFLVKRYLGYLIFLKYKFRKLKESQKANSRFF